MIVQQRPQILESDITGDFVREFVVRVLRQERTLLPERGSGESETRGAGDESGERAHDWSSGVVKLFVPLFEPFMVPV